MKFYPKPLQEAMTYGGWTLHGVAAVTGLSHSTVSRILRGITQRKSSVLKVAQALQVNIQDVWR